MHHVEAEDNLSRASSSWRLSLRSFFTYSTRKVNMLSVECMGCQYKWRRGDSTAELYQFLPMAFCLLPFSLFSVTITLFIVTCGSSIQCHVLNRIMGLQDSLT
jgi:hypothetical protein